MRLNYDLGKFSGDVFGGVTTGATVLPMALAYGVATGLGPLAGMYGAIAVGFCTAVFGGTPARISYVSAAMAVAMMVVLNRHADSPTEAFTIVMLAGVIQIALGILRVGRFITYTPYSMIAGFTSGIGIIIIIIQVLPFLGAEPAPGGLFGILRAWPDAALGVNIHAVIIGAVSLAICVFWPRRLGRFVPGPLPAVIVGTLLAVLWLRDAPAIDALPQGLPTLQLPEYSPNVLLDAAQPAVTLALIGSINSLVTSLVADSLTRTRHKSNRELVGQGIGNVAAGALGALPGAGATSGTTVNIRAGGNSPVSGVVCAGVLLALVLGIGWVAEPVPLAALSGVLIKAGWDIIDWRLIVRVRHVRREYVVVMLFTMLLTVFVDLITAIILGLIMAGFARARQSEQRELGSVRSVPILDREFFGDNDDDTQGDKFRARVGLLDLRGQFSFASASQLAWMVGADIEEHEVVILDFSNTVDMDDSAALVMERLIDAAISTHTEVIVLNLAGPVSDDLRSLNVLRRVPADRFAHSLDEARKLARNLLNERGE